MVPRKTSSKSPSSFLCSICNQSFSSAFARRGHLAKTHQNLLCRPCNRYYQSLETLLDHYRSDSTHPFCLQCEIAFPDKSTLSHHIKVAHPELVLSCEACQLVFTEQCALEDHWKQSQAHPLCLMCDRGLENLSGFDEHVRALHPSLFCEICGVGCQSDEQLQGHYRSSNDDLHPPCTICGDSFKSEVALAEHILLEHQVSPVDSSELFCVICEQILHHCLDLSSHYRDSPAHPTCIPCQIGFIDDMTYNEHLQTIHPTPTPYFVTPLAFSPVLSPPRSLRSLTSSSRTKVQDASRRPTPSPRMTSPTFFTTRSPPSNSADVRASPRADIIRQMTQDGSDAVITPAAWMLPIMITESPLQLAGIREHRTSEPRLALRIPEPLCTVVPLTPSALEQTPTYESRSSTPELLPTPSSLRSYSPRPLSPVHVATILSTVSTCGSTVLPTELAEAQTPFHDATDLQSLPGSSTSVSSTQSSPRVTTVSIPQPETLADVFEDALTSPQSFASLISELSDENDSPDGSAERSETTLEFTTSLCPGESVGDVEEHSKVPDTFAPNLPCDDPASSWHCRICASEPCDPTVTICGHLFCHGCIVKEFSKNFGCPVCKRMMFVRLDLDH